MEIKVVRFRVPVTIIRQSMLKETVRRLVIKELQIDAEDVVEVRILRSSIDARKKNDVRYDFQLYLKLHHDFPQLLQNQNITIYQAPPAMKYSSWTYSTRPVVVGFGPAGMFAALYLARCNARPVILERGSCMEERKIKVAEFLKSKQLDTNCNIQFGEGGAGTFSDGKLTTNLHNELIGFVLEEFYKHGATEDVTYESNPHVGTDYLEKVVQNIRREIIALGGEFHFDTCFNDFAINGSSLDIHTNHDLCFSTQHLLLCIGHSARDTIRHLYKKGVKMEAKSFSMGVRAEHLQSKINAIQYGKSARFLPPAGYRGAVHLAHRSVYTFCMCPGGMVMASTDTPNTIVTNGMSRKNRNEANANSALLVGITPADFYKDSPLDGLAFQERYEKAAFAIAGDYRAPANLMKEFLEGTIAGKVRSVRPSYPHGVVFCNLNRCLPPYVVQSLREAIPLFDKKLHGFNDADAVLTGIESRSSSPVRILRDEQRESNVAGIYPVGEGAGYAGGIVSAAIDGLKTAMTIVGTKRSIVREKS